MDPSLNPPNPTQNPSLAPGQTLGDYTVVEPVYSSRLTTIYRGRDALLGKLVAIVQLHPTVGEPASLAPGLSQWLAKYKTVAADRAEHLATFREFIANEQGLFAVREWIEGPTLRQVLENLAAQNQPMPAEQALGILAAVGKGLHALHEHQLIHAGLSPDTIVLPNEGGLKLVDAGLHATIDPQWALSDIAAPYSAPEVVQGQGYAHPADLYALGMIAYQALAGQSGYEQAFRTILRDERNQTLRWTKWQGNLRITAPPINEINPDVPADLSDLITRLTEKTASVRVPSAQALLAAIQRHFLNEQAAPDTAPTEDGPRLVPVADTAPIPTRSRLPLILGGFAAMWVLILAGVLVYGLNLRQQRLNTQRNALLADLKIADDAYDQADYTTAAAGYSALADDDAVFPSIRRLAHAGHLRVQAATALEEERFADARDHYLQLAELGVDAPAQVTQAVTNATQRWAFQDGTATIRELIDQGGLDNLNDAHTLIEQWQAVADAETETQTLAAISAELDDLRGESSEVRILARATNMVAEGRRTDAINYLQRNAERFPAVAERLEQLEAERDRDQDLAEAIEAENREDWGAALGAYNRALRFTPNDTALRASRDRALGQTLYQQALRSEQIGETQRAITLLREAVQADPLNASAQGLLDQLAGDDALQASLQRATTAERLSDWTAAIGHYQAALEHADTPGETRDIERRLTTARVHDLVAQGRAELDQGNLDTAREFHNRARRLDPNNDQLRIFDDRLAKQAEHVRLVEEAAVAYEQARFGDAVLRLRSALRLIDTPEVQALLLDAQYMVALTEAQRLVEAGAYREARSILRPLRSERPEDERVQALWADILRYLPDS